MESLQKVDVSKEWGTMHVEIPHHVSKDQGELRERKTRAPASNDRGSNIIPFFPLSSSMTKSLKVPDGNNILRDLWASAFPLTLQKMVKMMLIYGGLGAHASSIMQWLDS